MTLQHRTKTTFYIGLKTKNEKLEIHPEEIIEYIKQYVDAGTFYEGRALWNRELENCLVFECLDFSKHSGLSRKQLKENLEDEFKQDSVLTTRESLGAEF